MEYEAQDAPLPVLRGSPLWLKYIRELIIQEALRGMVFREDDTEKAWQQFVGRHGINESNTWRFGGLTNEELLTLAIRDFKIEKLKEARWGSTLEAYFLTRKTALDRVVYSIVRLKEPVLARELYFRIKEGEETFAEVASAHSEGAEVHTGGLIGPVPLGSPHPALAQVLASSQPGQVWPPMQMGEWTIIVRLDKLIPTPLDETVRAQLLQELFDRWVEEEVRQRYGPADPAMA